jgi:hypothetical protein
LADKYGNIVGNTDIPTVTVRVNSDYLANDTDAYTYFPVIEGSTSFTAIAGSFNVSGFSLVGTPGQTFCKIINLIMIYYLEVLFETNGIDTSKPSNAEYLTSLNVNGTNATTITFPYLVELRECLAGESFGDSGK